MSFSPWDWTLTSPVRFRWAWLSITQVKRRRTDEEFPSNGTGLTIDERDIIETAYRATIIRVIVCTSTLSSGVSRLVSSRLVSIDVRPSGQSPRPSGDHPQPIAERPLHRSEHLPPDGLVRFLLRSSQNVRFRSVERVEKVSIRKVKTPFLLRIRSVFSPRLSGKHFDLFAERSGSRAENVRPRRNETDSKLFFSHRNASEFQTRAAGNHRQWQSDDAGRASLVHSFDIFLHVFKVERR